MSKLKQNVIVINRSCVCDMRLSNEDLGVLIRLLALPNRYEDFCVEKLKEENIIPGSEKEIERSLNNLEELGYLKTEGEDTFISDEVIYGKDEF